MHNLTADELRLLRFGIRFASSGNWSPTGEDSMPSLEHLEELGLVELSLDRTKWRIDR